MEETGAKEFPPTGGASASESSREKDPSAETARTVKSMVFTIGMVAVSAVIVASAQSFTWQARLLPMFFGIPMLILSFVELVRSIQHLRSAERPARAPSATELLTVNNHPLLWFGALSVLVLLLGLTVGGALFFAAILRFHSGTTIATALLVGLSGGALYHVLLIRILSAASYSGMLGIA